MLAIPSALQTKFEEHLRNKTIQNSLHGVYKKWLQYYLDFCRKYHFPPIHKESLPHFIHKLQEKKQTKVQQEEAVMAIALYYEILDAKGLLNKVPMPQTTSPQKYTPFNAKQHITLREGPAMPIQKEKVIPLPSRVSAPASPAGNSAGTVGPSGKVNVERGNGASWKAEYSRLADEIHIRHYSSKTLQTYQGWVQKI